MRGKPVTTCCVLLLSTLLAGQTATPAEGNLQAEVRRLVRQLDSPQLAVREAAEANLLERGPAILAWLPTTGRASAEVQLRLGRVRQKLQQQAAEASVKTSTITLHADAMPLAKVLEAFRQQSGNAILDDRRQFGQLVTNPTLKVHFDNAPFWSALDQVLDQAGLTHYPFSEQQAIHIVAASGASPAPRVGRACCTGPFRIEPIHILARRNLRQADGTLVVTLEVAWEPRLRIIALLQRMADIAAVDGHGDRLSVADDEAQLEVPVGGGASAVKFDVSLRLPSRETREIANLKGRLQAVIPGKIETFRFNRLSGVKNAEQRIAGVTVTLAQVRKRGKAWEVFLRVRFDDAGDALASHRTWIFDNPAYLEGPDGKPIAPDGYETTRQGKNEVGIAYLFAVDRPLEELSFVYKTPGTIMTGEYSYELKNLKLP